MKAGLAFLGLLLLAAPAQAERFPADARQSFLESCIGLNRELIAPCKCILTELEQRVNFEQFEKLINQPTPDRDPRIARIARSCAKD